MLVREWFVRFTWLAKGDVAVSKLDNVYGSATAMKLCIVALWLPEAFLAVHACLAGFENHLWEPALCLCCSCSSGQGCVQAAAGSALLCRSVCSGAHYSSLLALPSSPAPQELWPHSTDLIHCQDGQGGVGAGAETPGHSGQLIEQTGGPKPSACPGV